MVQRRSSQPAPSQRPTYLAFLTYGPIDQKRALKSPAMTELMERNSPLFQSILRHFGNLFYKLGISQYALTSQIFQDFIEEINPSVPKIGATYLMDHLPSICANAQRKVRPVSTIIQTDANLSGQLNAIAASSFGQITITFDGGQTAQSQGALAVTAHFVDSQYKLRSDTVALRPFPNPHNAPHYAVCISQALRAFPELLPSLISLACFNTSPTRRYQSRRW